MPTFGQAQWLQTNINGVLSLMLVASFTFGIGLLVWHAASGQNPIATFLAQTALAQMQ
ncbi:MAG: hypothetical protein Q7S26_03970 [bacterium]|nr:hypothetical protein [bacterium]